MMISVGVDIGGTKVACGLVDRKGNCLEYAEVASIPADGERMFQQVVDCIRRVWPKAGAYETTPAGIGVGVPGKVDPSRGLAVVQNNLPWRNFPLVERIREHFPVDVVLDNDVCMATYGEWVIRGKPKEETFVYFTISTGIACCIIHRGHFLRGAGFAGEIGLIPFSGGLRLEEKGAGPAIGGGARSPREVIDAYRMGEQPAKRKLDEVLEEWARGLYAVVSLIDPHQLVLGGGVIHCNPFLLEEIRRKMVSYLIPVQKEALNRLSLSRLKARAGCVGAGLRLMHRNCCS